jgi:hypothetical protein
MAIANKQIGWSQESNLLWEVANKVSYLGQVISTSLANVGGGDNLGVFYVTRNYTGTGDALYNNFLNSTVTSSNQSFNDQLASAKMGDPGKPFPDPWAARNAAVTALNAGTITKAIVIVNGGQTWTVGYEFSTWNGSASGNSAINTVADIKLPIFIPSGTSLMQNNVDFFFHPGTTIINIADVAELHIGYNVDTTNTKWVSGIYGYGTFIAPYGTNNGFSQRMFQIGNGNGEMTVECDTIICQRAWFFVSNGESPALLKLKAKKVITDATGGLLVTILSLPVGTEATTPSSIIIDVDVVQRGQKYFPYASSAQVSSGDNTRQLVETRPIGLDTSTRQKSITVNVKQCYIHDTCLWLYRQGQHSSTEINHTVDINIGYLKHELNLTKTGFLIRGAIQFSGITSAGQRTNTHTTITINAAQVEEAILSAMNCTSRLAASANNSFVLKIGSIIKTGTYAGSTGQYIFGLPSTVAGSAGEPMKIVIDAGYAQSNLGNVFKAEELAFQGNTTYRDDVVVKGTFKTTASDPVINSTLPLAGNTGVILDNATLVTAGTQSISSSVAGDIYFSKQAYSNVAVNGANITTQGTFNVDANIANFI